MKSKRILVVSDFQCGHLVGLTPPGFDADREPVRHREFYDMRRTIWRWFKRTVKKLSPIDILIVNGDAVDGKGQASGGTEQLYMDRNDQAEMAAAVIRTIDAKKVVMSYGCLTPGHRVLTADLRWVPVEELVTGDALIGFDERPTAGLRRQMLVTHVTANKPITSLSYRLHLSDGTTIEASADHPFLLRRGGPYKWYSVEQLYWWMYKVHGERSKNSPIRFTRFFPVWDTLDNYEAGYLAGFFDADGSISQRKKEQRSGWPEHVFAIHGYQNENVALDTALSYLDELKFAHRCYEKGAASENRVIKLLGGRCEGMRFLGSVRPAYLLSRFKADILGTIKNPHDMELFITKIESLGEREVCGLGTDSGTYIAEGFLCHNTPYHTGQLEDWEDAVARDVGAEKIGGEDVIDVNGLIINYRHHVGRSTIPHGRFTPVAKEMLWNLLWAERDEYPKADVLIRSHVHYHVYCGSPGWLAMTTPALQGYGTKYGGRRMSGTVDIGMVVFDVRGKERYTWMAELLRLPKKPPISL